MKQNLTREQVIISFFFSVTGMIGKTSIIGLIFSVRECFFEVLGKDVARGPGQWHN